MSFDNSRFTFNPRKDYSGVVMQQGRVQMDSDWNEWLAEFTRRIQAGTLDILGRAVYPATTPYAFQITASTSAARNSLIGPGRMYVDGLLAENHGDPAAAKMGPGAGRDVGRAAATARFSHDRRHRLHTAALHAAEHHAARRHWAVLAYLDVWVRPVELSRTIPTSSTKPLAWIQPAACRPCGRSGSLDRSNSPARPATRRQFRLAAGAFCRPAQHRDHADGSLRPVLPDLRRGVHRHGEPVLPRGDSPAGSPEASACLPCCHRRDVQMVARQRVGHQRRHQHQQRHQCAGNPASQLTVQSLGRDQVLGFAPGNWIEILDDRLEFGQAARRAASDRQHRLLRQDHHPRNHTRRPDSATGDTNPNLHTRIRRWDQSGKVYEQDGVTVWWDIDAQGNGRHSRAALGHRAHPGERHHRELRSELRRGIVCNR